MWHVESLRSSRALCLPHFVGPKMLDQIVWPSRLESDQAVRIGPKLSGVGPSWQEWTKAKSHKFTLGVFTVEVYTLVKVLNEIWLILLCNVTNFAWISTFCLKFDLFCLKFEILKRTQNAQCEVHTLIGKTPSVLWKVWKRDLCCAWSVSTAGRKSMGSHFWLMNPATAATHGSLAQVILIRAAKVDHWRLVTVTHVTETVRKLDRPNMYGMMYTHDKMMSMNNKPLGPTISGANCFSGRYSPTYRVPDQMRDPMRRCMTNPPVSPLFKHILGHFGPWLAAT